MELRKVLSYCIELRRHFTVELLLQSGQPEGKIWKPFSLPPRIKQWWNYRADRCCDKINACKIIRSNLPSILYTLKNYACDVNVLFHFVPRGMVSHVYEHVTVPLELLDVNCGHFKCWLHLNVLARSIIYHKINVLKVYNKNVIAFKLWNIWHSFIWQRRIFHNINSITYNYSQI